MTEKFISRNVRFALAFALFAVGSIMNTSISMASDYGVSVSNGTQTNNPPSPPPSSRPTPPAVTAVRG